MHSTSVPATSVICNAEHPFDVTVVPAFAAAICRIDSCVTPVLVAAEVVDRREEMLVQV
jgi:hypothetical protein